MIERVFNEELNRFVYQIKKSDFMKGLNSNASERAWNELADKLFISVDFDDYRCASEFARMLVSKYSIFLMEA